MERRRGQPVTEEIKFPISAWASLILSLGISISALAYSIGIQSQKIQALEHDVTQHQSQLEQTPAILNELTNMCVPSE